MIFYIFLDSAVRYISKCELTGQRAAGDNGESNGLLQFPRGYRSCYTPAF